LAGDGLRDAVIDAPAPRKAQSVSKLPLPLSISLLLAPKLDAAFDHGVQLEAAVGD
jgi:hypothetical protein